MKFQIYVCFRHWTCLSNRPRDETTAAEVVQQRGNDIFSMDEQCRMEFGEGWVVNPSPYNMHTLLVEQSFEAHVPTPTVKLRKNRARNYEMRGKILLYRELPVFGSLCAVELSNQEIKFC